MRTTKQRRIRLAGLVLAFVAVGGVAACSNDSAGTSAAPAVAPNADAASGEAREKMAAVPQSPGDSASTSGPVKQAEQVEQPGVDRKLVRSATLALTSSDVRNTAARARGIAIGHGGYTGQEDVSDKFGTLMLYVPSDKLDKAIEELSAAELGKVESTKQAAQDVTEQLVDVESRIQTQRLSLERVRALLNRATELDDIVRTEAEVTRREADLESLLKRREKLAGSVAMSTVTLQISRDGTPPAKEADDSFVGALKDGWSAFLIAGNFVLRVVGTVLPFALVLGIPAYFVWQRLRRRGKAPVAPVVAQEG
jgi:hypothetical protein